MKQIGSITGLFSIVFILVVGCSAFADTVHLKNGSVIHGQVVGFHDQQFTVLVGEGTRGRRSQVQLYMEDVESIEFDNSGTFQAANSPGGGDVASVPAGGGYPSGGGAPVGQAPPPNNSAPVEQAPVNTSQPPVGGGPGAPTFFPINVQVRADNAANGWTNTGLVVRRGQRLHITASGRVSLGAGVYTTPTGLPRQPDNDKLMRNEPTGALVAVIGDDNDDFIYVGSNREFIAQRDGVLFLGLNCGNLANNSGAYNAVVEAEAMGTASP